MAQETDASQPNKPAPGPRPDDGPGGTGANPPPSGVEESSNTGWYLLAGCGGCGCLVLILLAVAGGFGYYWFQQNFYTDSQRVIEQAHEVLEYEFPGEERGMMGFEIFIDMAAVTDNPKQLNLIHVAVRIPGKGPAREQRKLLTNFTQNFQQGRFDEITTREERILTLGDRDITAIYEEGTKQTKQGELKMARYKACFGKGENTHCFISQARGAEYFEQLQQLVDSFRIPGNQADGEESGDPERTAVAF